MNALTSRFAGEPALVDPAMTARFESCLASVMAHPKAQEMLSGEYLMEGDYWQEDGGWCRPYTVVDGILQIPVKGVLLHNFPYQLYDWATGYDYIWQAFKRGCGDFATGSIKGIAFIGDSPGGMVAGCFDAVDKMVAMKTDTGVPVRGFAHESAYSACYAVIGGVSDHIAVSRTGGVGSIGVVTGHLDQSGAMEKAGLKFTYIASDPSKVEGNSFAPPSKDFLDRTQARIDELYAVFVAAIVRGRGLTESAIRNDLKAYCFTATQAVENGLADSIGSLEDATSAFADFLDDPSENQGEDEMAAPASSTVDQAVHDTAVATARTEGHAAGLAEGTAAGEKAAVERITAILGSDEGKKRPKAALSAALKTSMTVEQAAAFLGDLAEETAAPAPKAEGGTSFEDAMNRSNPDVGSGDGGGEQAETMDSIFALAGAIGLKGFDAPVAAK